MNSYGKRDTAHETEEEAQKETLDILELYRQLAEDYLAIPVLQE